MTDKKRHFIYPDGVAYTPNRPEDFDDHPLWREVLVIPKDELPEVTVDHDRFLPQIGTWTCYAEDPEDARLIALRYLAVAEYLTANPPVDPEQVEALAKELAVIWGSDASAWLAFTSEAERLIRAGWSK